jgi:hypothetical protein
MAAVNERLELEMVQEKLAQSLDRERDIERRRLHLEREIGFYEEAVLAEAQIQAKLKLQSRQTEQELRSLEENRSELRQAVRQHEKSKAMACQEAEASLQEFIKMSEDLALAVSKLKSMEALAKQLTEENYRLRLEQAEERPTASGLLKQTG